MARGSPAESGAGRPSDVSCALLWHIPVILFIYFKGIGNSLGVQLSLGVGSNCVSPGNEGLGEEGAAGMNPAGRG